MLPSVGYFKSILCPYFQDDSCERPYCQFRHEHLPVKQPKTLSAPKIEEPGSSKGLPMNEKSSALEEIVSEAVKRVLKENGQLLENLDASKIMELVGQHKLVEKVVENLVPAQAPKKPESNNSKNKAHKTYCIPAGVPAYTPTPISVLKKTKHEPSTPSLSYTPTSKSGGSGATTKSSSLEYDPTSSSIRKLSSSVCYEPNSRSQVTVSYSPSKPNATYTPSSLTATPGKDSKKSDTSGDASVTEGYFPSSSEYNPESLSKSRPKQQVAYEPTKTSYKHEDTYTPSTMDKVPEVEYKPSSKKADQEAADAYTPSSTLDCGVDYKPTVKEFSSSEPSYSPYSASSMAPTVDYAPSSIKLHQALTSEPGYSPMSTNNNRTHVNYAPSSIKLNQALTTEPTYSPASTNHSRPQVEYIPSSAGPPLSPEKYLALLEGLDDALEAESSETKQHASDDDKRKERQREKERQRRKQKERERDKRKGSRSSDSKSSSRQSSSTSSKRHKSSSESKSDSKSSKSKSSESKESPMTRDDDDEESGSDVDDECYRIFKEYKPAAGDGQPDDHKKRKTEEAPPASEAVIPVKKQRIAHVATEAPARPVPVARAPERLNPGMAMIERFKKAQEARAAAAAKAAPFGSPPGASGADKKRIAHVPNVMGLLTSRAKPAPGAAASSALSASTASSPMRPQQKPAAGPVNGVSRVAATSSSNQPAVKVPRPTIAIETNCRVPASIRQRYLNVLCDEALKIYDRAEDAFERAVEEEKQAYSKCSSKVVYINVITNLVQKIRREAEGSGNKASVSFNQAERKTQSHSAVLAGKGGATVSWSIEKPRATKVDSNLLKGATLYRLLERYVLTMDLQDIHGYPRPDPTERGKAVINTVNKYRQKPVGLNLAADQRCCDRCGTVYRVNSKGLAAKEDDTCTYHWGRKFYRRGESRYSCCQGDGTSEGCSVGKFHVTETGNMEHQRSGYVRTMVKSPPPDGNYGVYALDCEMCYTTEGPELTRVTVTSSDNATVYETLVKPDNPILDYNTRFSGISEEDMANVRTTIRDVQAVLLSKFSNKTILIGHSFDSDLRALKMIHDTVIDTSVVFPHPKGLPFKKALRTLCGEILQKIIQNDVGGHDSAEDAIACMELMLWKAKQDLKLMKT